ncbi:hypothetical protein [Streptomyces sp. NPDC057363]|uniref:hypothetical protein n=1 Tax=unclassified Streptomyces TaxID=2593676 RepID=UPI003637567F
MNGHQVRMVVRRPWQAPGIGAGGLQRDLAPQPLVVGEPHPARAAVAERTQQQIAAGDEQADFRPP